MRQIGTLSHENEARRFHNYLISQGIANRFEVSFDPKNGHMSYDLWIQEEDKLIEAARFFQEFEKDPQSSKFDAPEQEPPPIVLPDTAVPERPVHRFQTFLTYFLISVCAFVYLISLLQQMDLRKEGKQEVGSFLVPIQAALMFDLPPVFQRIEELIEQPNLSLKEVEDEIAIAQKTPYWKGAYDWVLNKWTKKDPVAGEGPLFVKIREGQVWRLFTPCILHKDLLHILFNMLWLWYLGRPIEQRIGPMRMLFFTLFAGIFTNVLQYLMSGPFFIGYSGIVTALAGFIWMREKIAPWEGYPLNRSTVLFLVFFILAILALQIVSFVLQVFTHYSFAPNIANTAHIAGALFGAFLARFHFFAQRIKP